VVVADTPPCRREPGCQPVDTSRHINPSGVLARLVERASAVINLVGILNESRAANFTQAHVELPRSIVAACVSARVRRLVHMSELNADPAGPSRYLRSKGEGEAVVAASGLDWTIFEPSVIFGREDRFLNLFANLLRFAPVMPLAGADARFQPVYVGDVAECMARALPLDATFGQKYPLCGPQIYALRDLVRYAGSLTGASPPIIALGPKLARIQATVLEHLPGSLMSRDNWLDGEGQRCGCEFRDVHCPAAARDCRTLLPRQRCAQKPLRHLSRPRWPLSRAGARSVGYCSRGDEPLPSRRWRGSRALR
jgi:NADH dehydrogenase